MALGTPLLASLMALLACVPVYLLGQRRGVTLVLVIERHRGAVFFQSLQSLLLFHGLARKYALVVLLAVRQPINRMAWRSATSCCCARAVVSLRLAWRRRLSAGEGSEAGINVETLAVVLLATTLLTAASVSFVSGTIAGSVGLIAPHFARFLVVDRAT